MQSPDKPAIPAGMVEVTETEFFAFIRGPWNTDNRDVMPSHENRRFTEWATTKGGPRQVVGWRFPGWSNPGDKPEIWALRADLARPENYQFERPEYTG